MLKHKNNFHSTEIKFSVHFPRYEEGIVMWRFNLILIIIICCYVTIALKLVELGISGVGDQVAILDMKRNKIVAINGDIARASIEDRNGVLLATNIMTSSIYARPKQFVDKAKAASSISQAIAGITEQQLLDKFFVEKEFVWIKRHITPEEQKRVHNLGIPGVYFVPDQKRFYPHENLCSHALGYVDIDGNGLAGIERAYDSRLKNDASTLQLALDIRVQNIIKEELQHAISLHNAVGGIGIMMDISTSEVVGMVSLPDFNLNKLNKTELKQSFNQATLAVNEMGSTFKILTIASALDFGKIAVDEAFDVSQPIKVGKYTIHDYRGKGGVLSVPEILMYSSNLGVAQIARRLGIAKQREYLRKFGMLSPVTFDIGEVGKPLYPNEKRWSDVHLATISYGHGIAVTALHSVQAMAAVVNGGLLHHPTLIKQAENQNGETKRVLSNNTSLMMRKLLRLVVEYGSGKAANVPGYFVGGKTGTVEKVVNGRYSKHTNIALFMGAFPINDPRYVIFVAIDEAKNNQVNKGFTTGGAIAAPAAGEIIRKTANILDVLPQEQDDPEVAKQMFVEYTPRYKMLAKR
ncbi:cell division protein FtsI (penicillin-binding protein 3) [Alphaproteobacteria bacterium]